MTAFTKQADYTPAGGPISAPAAGGQLGSSGWYDVSGGNWSVNASNQLQDAGYGGSPWQTGVLARATSEASTSDQQLRAKIVHNGGGYALLHYLRYSGAPNSQNGYLVNFDVDNSGNVTAYFFSVTGGSPNLISSTGIGQLSSGTTYSFVSCAVQTNSTTSTITAAIYGPDGQTLLSTTTQTDATGALQNANSRMALCAVNAAPPPILELTTYTAPSGTGTLTAPDPAALTAPNAPGMVYSPGNWNVTAASATTVNPGAYQTTIFTGASCKLNFDVSKLYTADPPAIRYRIDGQPWSRVILAANITCTIPSATSSYASHLLEWEVVATSGAAARWDLSGSTTSAVVFTGLTLGTGAMISAPGTAGLKVLVLTDSTGEGWHALAGSDAVASNDSAGSWIASLREKLGAEVGAVAFAGQGFGATGDGAVPSVGSTLGFVYSGVARDLTQFDAIVVVHGQNDGTNNVVSAITSVANALLAAAPSSTAIVFACPFTGLQKANITAALAACSSPARVAQVDPSGLTYPTTDTLHPNCVAGLGILGPKLGQLVRAELSSGVSAGSPPRFHPGFH